MKLGQGYIFTGVCDSVHRGVPDTPLGADTPQEQTTPLGADTPQEQTTPLGADTLPPRADTPRTRYPPDQVHPPGSRHPPGPDTPPGTRYTPPKEQTPPPQPGTSSQEQTPLGADTPLAQSMLGDTVNTRAVRILLECNLVSFDFMRTVWWFLSCVRRFMYLQLPSLPALSANLPHTLMH